MPHLKKLNIKIFDLLRKGTSTSTAVCSKIWLSYL